MTTRPTPLTDEFVKQCEIEYPVTGNGRCLVFARQLERDRAELMEALEKAADTFRDTKTVCMALGRVALADAMRIAEEGSRALLARLEAKG